MIKQRRSCLLGRINKLGSTASSALWQNRRGSELQAPGSTSPLGYCSCRYIYNDMKPEAEVEEQELV